MLLEKDEELRKRSLLIGDDDVLKKHSTDHAPVISEGKRLLGGYEQQEKEVRIKHNDSISSYENRNQMY